MNEFYNQLKAEGGHLHNRDYLGEMCNDLYSTKIEERCMDPITIGGIVLGITGLAVGVSSLEVVPPKYKGVKTTLGRVTKIAEQRGGLMFRLPVLQELILVDKEPVPYNKSGEGVVLTHDKVVVTKPDAYATVSVRDGGEGRLVEQLDILRTKKGRKVLSLGTDKEFLTTLGSETDAALSTVIMETQMHDLPQRMADLNRGELAVQLERRLGRIYGTVPIQVELGDDFVLQAARLEGEGKGQEALDALGTSLIQQGVMPVDLRLSGDKRMAEAGVSVIQVDSAQVGRYQVQEDVVEAYARYAAAGPRTAAELQMVQKLKNADLEEATIRTIRTSIAAEDNPNTTVVLGGGDGQAGMIGSLGAELKQMRGMMEQLRDEIRGGKQE